MVFACRRLALFLSYVVGAPVQPVMQGTRLCDVESLARMGCPQYEHGIDWHEFLHEACEHCVFGRRCSTADSVLRLVDIAKMTVNGSAAADEDGGFQCIKGVMAAAIVAGQFFLMRASDDLVELLATDTSLAPFPFRTSQWSLYTNMVPLSLNMCDHTLQKNLLDHYVPKAHPENSGACGLVYTDAQLVRRCRSRRYWKRDAYPVESGAIEEDRSREVLNKITCPDSTAIDLDEELSRKLKKYSDRARALQCQSGAGMWRRQMGEVHKCVLISIAHLLDFRPGNLVLDWGSGCGHKLSWAKQLFDVDGLGVDVEGDAVAWARDHSVGAFCHADGRDLTWIPDGIFDKVISYAAIYHLSREDQCSTGIQLVRKLRIGGRAWLGWNHLPNMSQIDWIECFKGSRIELERAQMNNEQAVLGVNVFLEILEDGFLFPPDATLVNDIFLYQYPAYSMMLTRVA